MGMRLVDSFEEDARIELESIYMNRVIERTEFGACWEWQGATDKDGYGIIATRKLGSTAKKVHRFMYELRFGPVDPDLCVMHTCDNPKCWKYGHLKVGTRADNCHDADAKGRRLGNVRMKEFNDYETHVNGETFGSPA